MRFTHNSTPEFYLNTQLILLLCGIKTKVLFWDTWFLLYQSCQIISICCMLWATIHSADMVNNVQSWPFRSKQHLLHLESKQYTLNTGVTKWIRNCWQVIIFYIFNYYLLGIGTNTHMDLCILKCVLYTVQCLNHVFIKQTTVKHTTRK